MAALRSLPATCSRSALATSGPSDYVSTALAAAVQALLENSECVLRLQLFVPNGLTHKLFEGTMQSVNE